MPLNHGLIDSIDISLEGLPASLEGLRIAHLTDTHITRPRPRFERLVRQLARLRLDLVVMTGDYTANPGHEAAAVAWMEMLTTHVKPAHGIFAVLGNHDSRALVGEAAHLPITFLSNASQRLPGLPIEIMGLELTCSQNPDSVALLLSRGVDEAQEDVEAAAATAVAAAPRPVLSSSASQYENNRRPDPAAIAPAPTSARPQRIMRFMLAHCADVLTTAADLGADLMFAGHTHGGQIRLPPGWPLFNSTDLPLHLTSGILRHRDTICLVSRGLGENGLPLRLFCPPHAPIYTLHEGPSPGQFTDAVENVRPW